MLMTDIKRETLTLPSETMDEVLTLAADAEMVLGYRLLQQTVEAPPEIPELKRVLAELGIEVLNRADVFAYMRERLCDRTLEILDQWQKDNPDPISSWGSGQSFMGPSWEATEISKYREAIPEFVINKALQIKRALPEVRILVRHLTEDNDPFLEVTLGDADKYDSDRNGSERYYIEVWDEPKFEGRLR